MSRRFKLEWKDPSGKVGETTIDTPVIALNLRMIDSRLKKAKLRTFKELIESNGDTGGLSAQEVTSVLKEALQYFEDNPESLPFTDMVVDDIPIALKTLKKVPKGAQLRLSLD